MGDLRMPPAEDPLVSCWVLGGVLSLRSARLLEDMWSKPMHDSYGSHGLWGSQAWAAHHIHKQRSSCLLQ